MWKAEKNRNRYKTRITKHTHTHTELQLVDKQRSKNLIKETLPSQCCLDSINELIWSFIAITSPKYPRKWQNRSFLLQIWNLQHCSNPMSTAVHNQSTTVPFYITETTFFIHIFLSKWSSPVTLFIWRYRDRCKVESETYIYVTHIVPIFRITAWF